MIIYHGSKDRIVKPEYGKGKARNDYGKGFYCTENIELAKEWACSDKSIDGYANQYELHTDDLQLFYLNSRKYNILNWLAVLTKYRTFWQKNSIAHEAKEYLWKHFFIDISSYDIIIGYRANDSYFAFAQDFISNGISLEQLSRAMKIGSLGEQVVLKSEKSFDNIFFMDSFPVSSEEYFPKKQERDKKARKEYRDYEKNVNRSSEIYMLDILREGMTNDDPRLYV